MITGALISDYGQLILVIVAALWTAPWKGVALWRAARRGDTVWFIVLLVVNTLALLEILYIFIFSKQKPLARSVASAKRAAPPSLLSGRTPPR
jgi:hypothetical protein